MAQIDCIAQGGFAMHIPAQHQLTAQGPLFVVATLPDHSSVSVSRAGNEGSSFTSVGKRHKVDRHEAQFASCGTMHVVQVTLVVVQSSKKYKFVTRRHSCQCVTCPRVL